MRSRRGPATVACRLAFFAIAAWVAVASSRDAGAATAEPVWIDQRQVGPFVFRAAFPLGDRLIADADLVGLQVELQRVLALRPARDPIEVILLKDKKQHRRLIKSRHPAAPYRRALYYQLDGRSVVYAYRHDELAVDLRHEGTHALLHADLPMVPLWLDEGLAEYFEVRKPARPVGGPGRLQRVLDDASRGRLGSLRDLEQKHELAQMDDDDYRHAWAWTHFLLHGPAPATNELWSYLSALRRWEPPGKMSDRLEAVLASPESELVSHMRRWPAVLRRAGGSGIDGGGLFR